MHPHLNIAIRAASGAGKVILRHINQVESLSTQAKGRNGFVCDVDLMAEQVILGILKEAYPEHTILTEESGSHGERGKSEYQWVVDPLNGTTNYLHGFPVYAVSIALLKRGVMQQSVVYDPLRDELFHASIGEGAFVNQRRMRLSRCKSVSTALIGTGFVFKPIEELDNCLDTFKRVLPRCKGMRHAGATALDLAYVAAGRLDGFWAMGLKPWHMAAGALLIQESTGIVTDFNGGDGYLKSGNLVTGGMAIHKELLPLVKPQ